MKLGRRMMKLWFHINAINCLVHAMLYWIVLCRSVVNTADPLLAPNCDHSADKVPCFQGGLPDRIAANIGDSALLPCLIFNVDFKSTVITWWKEGEFQEISLGTQVTDGRRFALQRSSSNEWSLIIKKVSKKDEGTYFCQINLSKLKERPYKLVVRGGDIGSQYDFNRNGILFGESPRTPTKPVDYEFVKDEAIHNVRKYTVSVSGDSYSYLNEPVSFSCKATFLFSTSDASVRWFHDGALQRSDPDQLIDITMRWDTNNTLYSVLTISKVKKKHSGDWTCKKYSSKNIEPKDSSKFPFTVYASKPKPQTSSDTNQPKRNLKSASLQGNQKNSCIRCVTPGIPVFLTNFLFLFYLHEFHVR